MLITIDSGNSNLSFRFFRDQQLVARASQAALPAMLKKWLQDEEEVVYALASSVKPFAWPKESIHWNILSLPIRRHANQPFLDMSVAYAATLGQDRLANAYAAFHWLKHQSLNSCLVVDAGTFTTVDWVERSGFQGGYIIPGDELLLNSYRHGHLLSSHVHAANEDQESIRTDWPQNTPQAMKQATHHMQIGFYRSLFERRRPDCILLTGGNREQHHQYLLQVLGPESDTIVDSPDLLHVGLMLAAHHMHDDLLGPVDQCFMPLGKKIKSDEVRL